MKNIDLIRWALQTSDEATRRVVADMDGANALTQPTDRGGNHPLWVVGHMTFIEGVIMQITMGEPNPVADWAPLFATGTQPSADASKYPPFETVLAKSRDVRARTLALLEKVGEAGLDTPPHSAPPAGFEDAMRTKGRAFLLLSLHQMMHHGQITDCRRAAGRKPFM